MWELVYVQWRVEVQLTVVAARADTTERRTAERMVAAVKFVELDELICDK